MKVFVTNSDKLCINILLNKIESYIVIFLKISEVLLTSLQLILLSFAKTAKTANVVSIFLNHANLCDDMK